MQTKEEKQTYSREYMRKYNATPKGQAYNQSHVKIWRKKNPNSPHNKNRKQSSVIYREAIVDFLFKRDGTVCDLCKIEITDKNYHIDHIVPYALGGPSILENFRVVHDKCNLQDALDIRAQIHGH